MLRLLFLTLSLTLPALPAAAQWIAVGRWGTEQSFRFVPPGTWMVEETASRTSISAEGDHHDGRLTVTCTPQPGSALLIFDPYHGFTLSLAAVALSGVPRVAATLAVDDQAFVLHFDQNPATQEWQAMLGAAVILDALAAGRRAELRTMDGQPVTAFGLTGASAAREALRRGCGI